MLICNAMKHVTRKSPNHSCYTCCCQILSSYTLICNAMKHVTRKSPNHTIQPAFKLLHLLLSNFEQLYAHLQRHATCHSTNRYASYHSLLSSCYTCCCQILSSYTLICNAMQHLNSTNKLV